MIPILFESTDTSFSTNGEGRLVDAISCVVTEERNGIYELEMQYPITGKHFSKLQHSRIIYATPADGKSGQPFRIYRITKPLDGICTIYAEHISYELNHIPVMPFSANGCADALQGLVNHSGQTNPFTVWTNKSVVGPFTLREPRPFRELLGGVQGSILDVYGKGEYEFDGYTVKLYINRGVDSGVTIRYAKNLTELVNDETLEDVYTGVCPYWASEDGTLVTLPEIAVYASTAANYPYKRTKIVDFSSEWEEAPTVAQLRDRAQTYITANNIGIPKVNIDVSFIPLWQTSGSSLGSPGAELVIPGRVNGDTLEDVNGTVDGDTVYLNDAYWALTFTDYKILERIHLCDTVTILYSELGVSHTAEVIKTVYNVLLDRYDSIEVGEPKTTIASIVTGIDSDISRVEAEATGDDISQRLMDYVDHQTELITGGLGGNVIIGKNANDEPNEILIMDTADKETATNVIRINEAGIGFSTSGYSGPFTSAWTIDGIFNTDFIGAGSITGVQIAAGSITAGNLSLYGKMGVYTTSALTTNGGYIGYMSGATASGTTNGIAIMDSASRNYVMATTAGVKMQNGSASTPGEINISDGIMEFVGRGAYIQGEVYLNATSSGGAVTYSGTTRGRYFSAVNDSGVELVSITGSANGNVYVKSSSGTNLLYLGANGGNGYISLKDSSGTDLAALTAGDYGGAVSVRNSNGIQQAYIGIDSRGHGTMSINTVVLDVNNYGGRLNLKNIAGNDRAVMALSAYGGSLFLYNTTNEYRVSLAVDGTYGGVLTLWNNAGSYHTLTYALLDKLINL